MSQHGQHLVAAVHTQHPKPCRYEDYPTDVLMAALEDFNKTSGNTALAAYTERGGPPEDRPRISAALEIFMAVPHEEQAELVREVQGYD